MVDIVPVKNKGAKFALFVLLIMSTLSFLDRKALSLLVEPIRHDLHITDFQFSLIQGASFSVFYIILSYPLGWLVDRLSRRWIIYAGVSIWSLATIASGLSANFSQMLAARSVLGVGEAGLGPAAYSLLADMFPKRKLGAALTIFGTGAVIGGAGAFLLGGFLTVMFGKQGGITLPLLGHIHSWQLVLAMMGLMGVVLGPLIFSFSEPRRNPSPVVLSEGWRLLDYLRARPLFYVCLFIGAGSHALVASAGAVWGAAFMLRTFHWDIASVGVTLAVLGTISGLGGMLASGFLVDWMFGRGVRDAHMVIFSTYAAVSTVTGVAAYLCTTPWIYLSLSALHGATSGIGGLAAATLAVASPGELRGRLSGILVLVINLGTLGLAPSVVAMFTDFVFHDDAKIGWSLASVVAIFGPIAFVALMIGRRPMRDIVCELDGVQPAHVERAPPAHLAPRAAGPR